MLVWSPAEADQLSSCCQPFLHCLEREWAAGLFHTAKAKETPVVQGLVLARACSLSLRIPLGRGTCLKDKHPYWRSSKRGSVYHSWSTAYTRCIPAGTSNLHKPFPSLKVHLQHKGLRCTGWQNHMEGRADISQGNFWKLFHCTPLICMLPLHRMTCRERRYARLRIAIQCTRWSSTYRSHTGRTFRTSSATQRTLSLGIEMTQRSHPGTYHMGGIPHHRARSWTSQSRDRLCNLPYRTPWDKTCMPCIPSREWSQ